MLILRHWVYLIIIGAGSGAWAVHINIADYPVPDATRKLGWLVVAGGMGGLVAAALFPELNQSDPMPGLVGVAAAIGLGLVASAVTGLAAGLANKQHLLK
jgi:hypothetical protein